MDFHLEFFPRPFETAIEHQHRLMLVGSCFTENITQKLKLHKFSVLENPNGILFNPVSIAQSVTSYIENRIYTEQDLFHHNESWHSWAHHSRFSHPDKAVCLQQINRSQQEAHHFLQTADWILITLGSAFVYEKKEKGVVANCHKIPTDKFNKRLLKAEEVLSVLDNVMHRLFIFNHKLKIIFTISPVRHLRDGFIENNRSKAILIQTVHHLVNKFDKLFYFPAYELVVDDLRDYRFYAEDMVHPNYAATHYVWDKFVATCIDPAARTLMKDIQSIHAAYTHKPFNPASEQHRKFLRSNLEKIQLLKQAYPYLDFTEEERYFGVS